MKIGVIGAGAVGGYFGALLAEAGEDVTFLVREGRYQALQHGLTVKSVHGDLFLAKPKLARSGEELIGCEVVLIAVKQYHLEGVWNDLRILAEGGAVLLPLLNGVRHMERLERDFGATRVLGGSCHIETTLDETGAVVQTSDIRDIVYGALGDEGSVDPLTESVLDRLQEAFLRAHIPAVRRVHILRELWKKYVFLCAFSGMTAATRSTIGIIWREHSTRLALAQMFGELIAVAQANGIDLQETFHAAMMERVAGLNPLMTSSMHRDLEKGRPLELDSLQGDLIAMAEEREVDAPIHRTIYAVLAPHRHGRR